MILGLEELRKIAENVPKFKDIAVPELGGTIRLLKLGAKDRIELGRLFGAYKLTDNQLAPDDVVQFYVRVLAYSIINEGGVAVFRSDEGQEVLCGLDPGVLLRLGQEAASLNGLSGGTAEEEHGVTEKK